MRRKSFRKKTIKFIKERPMLWLVVFWFLVMIGAVIYIFYPYFIPSKAPAVEEKSPQENMVLQAGVRLLDGLPAESEDRINPPIFAVQIDNMSVARPLSGVSKASIIYEAPVEGEITRFLALFTADATAEEIGPVRSSRPYFIDWAEEYGALYAHSGGSSEALQMLPNYDVLNLDEFANSCYYKRSARRYPPHNLYTSVELFNGAFLTKEGKAKDFSSWQFKTETNLEARPTEEKTVTIDFSSPDYLVGWQYDREKNDYLRFEAGKAQTDRDGAEVRAKNVIIQFAKIKVLDSVGRKKIETIGSGEAIVLQDGVRIDGQWKKEKRGERTKFYDKNGAEIKFNPGVTWIEVVEEGTEVK